MFFATGPNGVETAGRNCVVAADRSIKASSASKAALKKYVPFLHHAYGVIIFQSPSKRFQHTLGWPRPRPCPRPRPRPRPWVKVEEYRDDMAIIGCEFPCPTSLKTCRSLLQVLKMRHYVLLHIIVVKEIWRRRCLHILSHLILVS